MHLKKLYWKYQNVHLRVHWFLWFTVIHSLVTESALRHREEGGGCLSFREYNWNSIKSSWAKTLKVFFLKLSKEGPDMHADCEFNPASQHEGGWQVLWSGTAVHAVHNRCTLETLPELAQRMMAPWGDSNNSETFMNQGQKNTKFIYTAIL